MALPIFQRTVVTNNGDVVPNAEVLVVSESTGLAIDLFEDRAGTIVLPNPFFTGADALARFYANPGEYRVTASGAQGQATWRYVQLIDSQDITTIGSNFAAVETASANIQAIIDAPQAATDATTAKLAAEAALAEFEGTYYGALASNPTLDPLGNPINEGDLYFNSTANELRVYDGVSWVVATATANNVSYNNTTSGATAVNVQTALDEAFGTMVKLAGDQTVAGIKTFSSSPVVPNATTAGQALAYGQVAVANSAAVKVALNAGGLAPIYACRAWVNFNGTGTVAIRASGNVSSITDNGVGTYTVNFITAMVDLSYSCFTQVVESGTSNEISSPRTISGWGLSSVSIIATKSGVGVYDPEIMSVSIFR